MSQRRFESSKHERSEGQNLGRKGADGEGTRNELRKEAVEAVGENTVRRIIRSQRMRCVTTGPGVAEVVGHDIGRARKVL